MTTSKCQRCTTETHRLEKCNYCGKFICHSCTKSSCLSKKRKKGERFVICKTCWGDPRKRTKHKSD